MRNEFQCSLEPDREARLMAYLYHDGEPEERRAVEAHLDTCRLCRSELDGFGRVRDRLASWALVEPVSGVGGHAPRVPLRLAPDPPVRRLAALRTLPPWMQGVAAAALLVAALGVANLEVRYGQDGVITVRTGWRHNGAPESTAQGGGAALGVPTSDAQTADAPSDAWRRELAALAAQLRSEMAAERVPPVLSRAAAPVNPDALMRDVRALMADSERRQQRELALRVAELAREAQVQRQADLVKIERSLGLIQNRTGVQVMRTQQQLNSLAQRVSQQP